MAARRAWRRWRSGASWREPPRVDADRLGEQLELAARLADGMRSDSPRPQFLGAIAFVAVDRVDRPCPRLEGVVDEIQKPGVIAERQDPIDAELLLEPRDYRPAREEAGAVRAQ